MQSTAEAGRELLRVLSDDELARYGEIARDQASAELSRWWLQAVLAVAALRVRWAAAKWGIAGIETVGHRGAGFGRAVAVGAWGRAGAGLFALPAGQELDAVERGTARRCGPSRSGAHGALSERG